MGLHHTTEKPYLIIPGAEILLTVPRDSLERPQRWKFWDLRRGILLMSYSLEATKFVLPYHSPLFLRGGNRFFLATFLSDPSISPLTISPPVPTHLFIFNATWGESKSSRFRVTNTFQAPLDLSRYDISLSSLQLGRADLDGLGPTLLVLVKLGLATPTETLCAAAAIPYSVVDAPASNHLTKMSFHKFILPHAIDCVSSISIIQIRSPC